MTNSEPNSKPKRAYTCKPKRCEMCGGTYTPTGGRQRFCDPCGEIYQNTVMKAYYKDYRARWYRQHHTTQADIYALYKLQTIRELKAHDEREGYQYPDPKDAADQINKLLERAANGARLP